jgi:hypothetical protein
MPLVRLTAGVGQVDHDLRTLDPPCGAGVLALHPDRGGALLQVPGLIDHQDPARLAEPGHHPVPHVTQHPIRIPRRRGQQPLHPPRAGLTGMLGQAPTVRARQPGHHPKHEAPQPQPRFHPAHPSRHAAQKVIQSRQPAARIYAMACGHRPVFFGPHNQDPRAVAALDFGPTRTLRNEVSLSH